LRWIKAMQAKSAQIINMFRNQKPAADPPPHDAARNLGSMTVRLGLDAEPAGSPAAWPAGVSLLAQLIDACQRCDTTDVCNDWLARAPKSIVKPPAFCPNADALTRAKKRA
jgi:hypothetical protein